VTTHTHVGCRAHTGYTHHGRLSGHTEPRPGVRHALNRSPRPARGYLPDYVSLCGEGVHARLADEFGGPVVPNVRPVGDPEARPVTCKRCLRLMAAE
jgi:hypothetical protein